MRRILIVEDNPIEAREIGFFLREAGFELEIATTAEQGFQHLLSGTFELLLTDLHLPGEDGFAFCRRVKGDARVGEVPVVLLTRFADPLNVLRGLEAGAEGFISKGQPPADIVARLQRILSRPLVDVSAATAAPRRIMFLQTEFEVKSDRDQLLDALLSGFEDTLYLNQKYEDAVVDRAQAQKSLRDMAILYQSLVETLPLGILRKDSAGVYTFVNQEFCRHVGKSTAEIIGKTDAELYPAELSERLRLDDAAVLSRGRVSDHVEAGRSAAGETIYTQTRKSPLRDSKGMVIGLQGIVWDVTDFKQAEDQLRFLNKSLEECVARRTAELATRNTELEQRNIDLDQYAYIASHDLQEPLRKLISFSQLLEQDVGAALNEAARMDLFYIMQAAGRMQQLVQDLLAFSRAGRAQMSHEPVALDECVERALDALAVRIAESAATIERVALPTVCGDPVALTQLYQNLIGNALKFVRDRQPMIRLTATPAGDAWTLAVADNGIGIEPQYAQQIFAPFKRLHSRSEYEGTGIGLAICQTVVERHGGKIWVESQPGIGSQFKFTLPAESAPASEQAVAHGELLTVASDA